MKAFVNKTVIVADFCLSNTKVIKRAATYCSTKEIYRERCKEA